MRQDFKKRHADNFWLEVTSLGGYLFYFLSVAFFLMLKEYRIAKKLIFGLMMLLIITAVVRWFFFKERPKKYAYTNIIEKLDAASFPSLHAARSSLLLAVLADYANNTVFSLVSIIIILLVCHSRIRLQKHDLKDVSAGVVLGIFAYFILNAV